VVVHSLWVLFYSIACANKPDGSLDTRNGPCPAQRTSSKSAEAFPCSRRWRDFDFAEAGLSLSADCPENVLVAIIGELAQEQDWSTFKNEAAKYQGTRGADYVRVLHDVWSVMNRLQARGIEIEHETSDKEQLSDAQ
jgi:hypothetical protein